jgi:hypothetical protein
MSYRTELFRKPPPQGWAPKVGDPVHVRQSMISFGRVKAVGGGAAVGEYSVQFTPTRRRRLLAIDDLRPVAPDPDPATTG